jgi:hypothetical protein
MEFDGRIDKKFCCDQCRNTYNNKAYQDDYLYTRQINGIIKHNRNILSDLFQKYSNRKIGKEKFIAAGFNFDYLSNFYKTKTGKTYFFCYDYGYIMLEDDLISIVERKEYVD